MGYQPGGADYYAVLGLHSSAPAEEIKATYRALAKALHPDSASSGPGDEERFKQVAEAYAVLGNEESRRRYDQALGSGALDEWAAMMGHMFAAAAEPADPEH